MISLSRALAAYLVRDRVTVRVRDSARVRVRVSARFRVRVSEHGVELDACDVLGLGRADCAVARALRRTHVAVVPADLVRVRVRARVRVSVRVRVRVR